MKNCDPGYFAHTNASGSVVSYATESEPIKAWNKSNVDVQIEVKAKLNIATPSTATNSNIEIEAGSVANDPSNDRKIYIALRASGSNTALTASESTVTDTIASASNAYETKVVNGEYKKILKASASTATTDAERAIYFKSYSFSLTGDCNATKEWSKLDVAPPEVTLTWKIDKPDGAVEATDGPTVTMSKTGIITMSGLTANKNYAHSAKLAYGSKSDELDTDPNMDWDVTKWSTTNGGTLIFKLSSAWLSALNGKQATITVKLSDDTTITATQQF